jgi:hypothetical protein
MTNLYDQLYENFLAEQDIDEDEFCNDDLSDTEELDDELLDDENLPIDNIVRQERIEPEIRLLWNPNENSLPKATNESQRLADYFKLRSDEVHYGDILCKIKTDGLEEPRLDLTKILSRWFPDKKVRWISLKCIGASNYCVSSNGDICHLHMRRILRFGNVKYAAVSMMLDNGARLYVAVHNLVATAFWQYPPFTKMTIDHQNRESQDNNYLNLSWETIETQILNRRKYLFKLRPVNQIDPIDGHVIKEWNNVHEIAEYFDSKQSTIYRNISGHRLFKDSLWEYHEPILEDEEFKPVPIDGLDKIFVSNKGRCMLRNGHITTGYLHHSKCRIVFILNTLIGRKPYLVHILVALTWIPNDRPERKIVNHKNHVRDDNAIENLEWVTVSENNKHGNMHRRRINYTDENGQMVEFPSMTEASKITNIPMSTIKLECQKSSMGKLRKFSYVDDNARIGSGMPAVQCDLLSGQVLFIWESASHATLHTDIFRITDVILGTRKSAGGFFWRRPTIFEAPWDIAKMPDLSVLKRKSQNAIIDGVVEIYELNNNLTINIYKSAKQAEKETGINRRSISDSMKLQRKGYDRGDGIIRWFLYQKEYERRIKNNEPLIQVNEITDDSNRPIVVLTLTGDFVTECPSIKEVAIFLRSQTTTRFTRSTITEVARGRAHTLIGYRFAFSEDYYRDPNSYKENLSTHVLKAIKQSMG